MGSTLTASRTGHIHAAEEPTSPLTRIRASMAIVAISANAMPHDIARGLKAGFFLYLTKPIKIAEFNSTLDAALEFAGKGPGASRTHGTAM